MSFFRKRELEVPKTDTEIAANVRAQRDADDIKEAKYRATMRRYCYVAVTQREAIRDFYIDDELIIDIHGEGKLWEYRNFILIRHNPVEFIKKALQDGLVTSTEGLKIKEISLAYEKPISDFKNSIGISTTKFY